MKKFMGLALVSVLSMSLLAGCGNSSAPTDANKEPVKEEATYKDGKYKASYDKLDTHGWKAFTEVEIKDGKIVTVDFDYLNEKDERKSENEAYNKAMSKSCETSPEKFTPEIEKALVDAQDPEKADVVTGATHSTENMKTLAKAALESAKKGDTKEVLVPQPDVKEDTK